MTLGYSDLQHRARSIVGFAAVSIILGAAMGALGAAVVRAQDAEPLLEESIPISEQPAMQQPADVPEYEAPAAPVRDAPVVVNANNADAGISSATDVQDSTIDATDSTDPASATEIDAQDIAPPEPPKPMIHSVKLRGLNKVTGKTSQIEARIGVTAYFDNLEIVARHCWKAPASARPENVALLDIWERKPAEAPVRVYYGWMFASSPSVSPMEHPVYDVTVLDCVSKVMQPGDGSE